MHFGVAQALIGEFRRHDETHPSGADIERPWYSLNYTFHMEEGTAELPRPPID